MLMRKRFFYGLLDALFEIGEKLLGIFPAQPRTKASIETFGLAAKVAASNIKLIEPLGYLNFMRLYSGGRFVLTDSSGLQEETTAFSVSCLTLRENTKRPITISHGTNILVGTNPEKIKRAVFEILSTKNSSADKNSAAVGRTRGGTNLRCFDTK